MTLIGNSKMNETLEKRELIKAETVETADGYIKRVFPLRTGECKVKYCPVGVNKFRINFYTDRTPDSFMSDLHIGRSHYVMLKEEGNSWSHEIL